MSEQTPESLFDPALQQCPYPHYDTLRSSNGIARCPITGMFLITRFEDARRVLTDPDTFSSRTRSAEEVARPTGRQQKVQELFETEGWLPAPTLASRDEPEHKAVRALFDEAFRPKRVQGLDPEVRDLAYRLIDDFLPDGHCDWVKQFSIPLPLLIIGRQMGANPEDIWRIKEWTDAFFHRISFMLDETAELEAVRKEIEGQHYFQPIFDRLREQPDNTLLSELVNTVIDTWGRPLTDNELHAEMMADTFVGGSETTTNAISAGVKLLIENKNIWDRLKSDPDRYVRPFTEEVLRLESPVQGLMRRAARDVELAGTLIPEGSLLNVRFAAANRDENRFTDAALIDLDRRAVGGHLAFGSGPHHCLGAPLARRELIWSFTALVDRIDDLWFTTDPAEHRYHPHFLLRSLIALPVGFKPA